MKKKNKIFIISASALLVGAVIVVVIVLLFSSHKNKSMSIAEKLGAKCGEQIVVAEKNADINMSVKSKSAAINNMKDAKYFYESDDMIEVDGVKVPEWSIRIDMEQDTVYKVYYRNFKIQDDNYKGEKVKTPIRTLKIHEGMSKQDVEDVVGIDPVAVTYFKDSVIYDYKYYCVNSDKNEHAYTLKVTYSRNKKVVDVENKDIVNNPNIE